MFLFVFCNPVSEMVKSHQKPPMSPLASQPSFSMYELTWWLSYFWYIVCFCFKKELCTSWHDMAQLMGFYLLCPSVVRTEGASCNISHQMMMNNKNNYISTSNISQMHMKDTSELQKQQTTAFLMVGSGVEPGLPNNTYRTWNSNKLYETKNEVLDESVDDDELVTAEDTYTDGLWLVHYCTIFLWDLGWIIQKSKWQYRKHLVGQLSSLLRQTWSHWNFRPFLNVKKHSRN